MRDPHDDSSEVIIQLLMCLDDVLYTTWKQIRQWGNRPIESTSSGINDLIRTHRFWTLVSSFWSISTHKTCNLLCEFVLRILTSEIAIFKISWRCAHWWWRDLKLKRTRITPKEPTPKTMCFLHLQFDLPSSGCLTEPARPKYWPAVAQLGRRWGPILE